MESKIHSDRYLLQRLSKYLLQSKFKLFLTFILILLSISIQILLPLILSTIIDNGLLNSNQTLLLRYILIYFSLQISYNLFQYGIELYFAVIGETSIYNLRLDVLKKVHQHDQVFFDTHSTGDTISRITTDIENMQHLLSGSALYSILSIFQIFGIIIIMLQNSIILTFVTLLTIPLSYLAMWLNKKHIREVLQESSDQIGEISSIITENILGAKVNAAYVRSIENTKEFEITNNKLFRTTFRANRNAAFIQPIAGVFSYLIMATLLLVGIMLRNNGNDEITVGVMVLFIIYSRNLRDPIVQITSLTNQIQNSFASFGRIISLYDIHNSINEKDDSRDLVLKGGNIELKEVDFGYSENSLVLNNFTLNINPCEKIAIVGHTGAGKSTISRLIARIYDINKGAILIDGQNIQNVSLRSLREHIGVVLQEPILYSDSIRDNLNLGKIIPDEQLYEILSIIGADFVKEFPNGLDTLVGERGSRLSSGQKQLLSFARTLVHNPEIIILDEATSSIDPQTELLIQRALNKILENKTTIMIAHRLSTVKIADRIIVLADGKIKEQGSFEELLSKRGEFFELYNLQFKN